MKILQIHPSNIDSRKIAECVEALQRGELIIYPTDTLYAIGCNALNNRSVENLCHIKGLNPAKNLLSIVCSDLSMAALYARIDKRAFALMRRNLPGPFTFILPLASTLPKVFKGRRNVGIRIPDNPIALALAKELGGPLMTSSVDVPDGSDEIEAEAIALTYEAATDIAYAVDGGPTGIKPSTVVNCLDSLYPEIIRQGAGELN